MLERGHLSAPNGADVLPLEPGALAHDCPRVRGRVAGQPAVLLVNSGFDGFAWMEQSVPREYGLAFEDVPVLAGGGATWLLGGAFLREVVTTFGQRTQRVRLSKP